MTREEIERSQETWKLAIYDAYAGCDFIDAYKHNLLYIVHGEMTIACYDSQYQLLWEFSARDIFVCPDSSCAFQMDDDGIWIKDWLGYSYFLNYDGKCVRELEPN